MIQAISFGNKTKYVTEGTIYAKIEVEEMAQKVANAVKRDARIKSRAANIEYASPFANYTQADSAFPHYPSPEASYALSHGHLPAEVGQKINIISKSL